MKSVSVVIPVKDAGPLLERVLQAVLEQGDLELLVIDSGSRDRSREVAQAAGATLMEIEPASFGHGRTRNLGAERTSGELICFLTQDAVPAEGWLDGYREVFELPVDRVGAAYGPHLPHADTSPMIARELTQFFASFAPYGGPAVQRAGEASFLSNVNACYSRGCWEEIRFPDVPYAEDQAFGRAMLEAGWVKVYQPAAAVFHAHDYGPLAFMRRYFDEYRGLRDTTGHVEWLRPAEVMREVKRDVSWMRERGLVGEIRGRWLAHSLAHHSARRVGSALGSRAHRLPAGVQRRLSLERRAEPRPEADPVPVRSGRLVQPESAVHTYDSVLQLNRHGPAPLAEPVAGMAARERLHVAVLIPPFQRGSGGHNTIFTLLERLERMGHDCSIWMHDPLGRHHEDGSVLRRRIVEEFAPVRAPVFKGFGHWHGADVAMATGWDTAYVAMLLPHCRARAYLIQDHEPEFFATSAESLWAAGTYELGLHGIAAGRWLQQLLERLYGQRGGWFRLGVDRNFYRPRPVERRRDTVLFYGREYTPRRGVPLGALALQQLLERRPDVRIQVFGQDEAIRLPVPYEQLGVVSPQELSWHYSRATVGLCLSFTNYSLIPQEMLACGLPCVDLRGGSTESELGTGGPAALADADPISIATTLDQLLSSPQEWGQRARAGLAWAEQATWNTAARQVEGVLRDALREREPVGTS